MRARLFSVAVLAAATLPGAARAQDLNVITSVALKDEGSTMVLSVKGSKAPNFTTFSMADPPRFVIDLSESRFEGVPEDIVVQDGIVNVVKNLSYGSASTSIARIMIAFQVDVEPPDVQTSGTTLLVRVTKPGAPAVAAKPAAPAPQAAAQAPPAATTATTGGGGGGGAPAGGGGAGAAVAATGAVAAGASAEQDRKAREQAEAQARAEEQRKAEEAAAAAKAEEDRKAREAADAQAKAKAEEQARLEQEAVAREQAEAKARDEAEARRLAEKENPPKVAAAAPAAAREEPPPPPPVPEAPMAAAPTPTPTARLEAGAPSAQLREVGFRQLPSASRVFVRTSVTPRFTVQDVGQNTIRVELENTRVSRRNDTRFLDTSFFSSAVAMVTPSRRGSTYVVDIKLREKVPYQQKIEGDMLALDFERPARAPAAPASGSAAGDTTSPDGGPAPGPRDDTAPAPAPAEGARPAEGEPPPTLK